MSVRRGADLAVLLEEIGKDGMGVHGDVSEDVVEDVGLGRVFERVAAAQPGGGGKLTRGEHLEEGVGRQKAADRRGVPAGAWAEALVDLGEIGDGVFAQADLVEAVEILLAGVLARAEACGGAPVRPRRRAARVCRPPSPAG